MKLLGRRKKKYLVVTIHGFGKNRSHELDGLCQFLNEHGFATRQFDIYSLEDANDGDARTWMRRCERQMQEAFTENPNIILVGFSMGGVIASYLATVYKVKMLVLVAPAFKYLDFEKVAKSVSKSVSRKKEPEVPSSVQTKGFRDIVSLYKHAIEHVDCPVLILHGTEDEIIDPSSSHEAYKKIPHENKRLIYLEGARHKLLYDGMLEQTAFRIILDFLQGKLF